MIFFTSAFLRVYIKGFNIGVTMVQNTVTALSMGKVVMGLKQRNEQDTKNEMTTVNERHRWTGPRGALQSCESSGSAG